MNAPAVNPEQQQHCFNLPERPARAGTMFQQTGWTRPHPHGLCQDMEVLLRVTEYDFDLSDPGFIRYAESRGVLHVAGEQGSRRRAFIGDFSKGEADFRADDYFTWSEANEANHFTPLPYSDAELATQWQVIRLSRARLQDAWELYRIHG